MVNVARVTLRRHGGEEWYARGGTKEDAEEWGDKALGNGNRMFYRFGYDPRTARFLTAEGDEETQALVSAASRGGVCRLCAEAAEERAARTPVMEETVEDDMSAEAAPERTVKFGKIKYHAGDAVFLAPDAFEREHDLQERRSEIEERERCLQRWKDRRADEEKFPHMYLQGEAE